MKNFTPKTAHSLVFVAVLLFAVGCGGGYNTNFPPPDPNQSVEQTFPEKIGELPRTITRMNLPPQVIGFEARYGNGDIVIQLMQAKDNEEADQFFKQTIVPTFDALPTHSRGQVNGKWTASGKDKDGRIWYGWVNQNWSFVLNASNKDNFEKILGNFKFIAK